MASRIVRAVIHPGIGIARVGNSRDGFFIGPEVQFPDAPPPNFFKDAAGGLKRQAARFRLYGVDKRGRVVEEMANVHSGRAAIRRSTSVPLPAPEGPDSTIRKPPG